MKIIVIVILSITFLLPLKLISQSVVNTVHNLSVSGPGNVKASDEGRVCIFCHTPHNSKPRSPLWNREDPGLLYTLYDNNVSSTFQATTGQPDGSSVMCLSCHDGTIALGKVLSEPTPIPFGGGVTTMPNGRSNLQTDLSNDHPVSFVYNSSLAVADGQLKSKPLFPAHVDKNSKVQCVSCHDPHKNPFKKFLNSSSEFSELCMNCHDRTYWSGSSHESSTATWNGSGKNPWSHIEEPFGSVAQNACESCHNTHNADGKERLLKSQFEEKNCFDCHNGNVANTNVETDFTKIYRHNVFAYNSIHDANESDITSNKHVECSDCHNPHATNSSPAVAPIASGALAGVRGVDQNGVATKEVQYEYEVCYRCHSQNAVTKSTTTRQIEQNNVRLEFEPGNPSSHPIAEVGNNSNVPSLILPLSEASGIYCTDCHASNNSSAKGPHGSIYPQIMKYRYETKDNTFESAASYELCYSCHNRSSIMNDDSFKEHSMHIRDENTSCNICHDPHGINSSQGNPTNNSNLINFDTDVVSPNSNGELQFIDNGNFNGYCQLKCHGKTHTINMDY